MTDETISRLRISLADTEPEVWRRVDVPLTASLKMLHDIIQAAMGWEDYHLWMFEAEERRYGLPDPEWPDQELTAAKNVKLGALIERGVRELTYTYDMGDNWEHRVTVETVRPGDADTKYPRFIDGARRCPPEDVGGTPGFDNFLEAMAEASTLPPASSSRISTPSSSDTMRTQSHIDGPSPPTRYSPPSGASAKQPNAHYAANFKFT